MYKAIIIFGLSLCIYVGTESTARCQSLVLSQTLVEDAVNFFYDPGTGGLEMKAVGKGADGNPLLVTTLELQSEGKFNPDLVCPTFTGGAFDVATANKLFMLRAGAQAVGEQCLGTPLPLGLLKDDVIELFTKVDGSITPSGRLVDAPGGGPYLVNCPEPSAALLLLIGLAAIVRTSCVRKD